MKFGRVLILCVLVLSALSAGAETDLNSGDPQIIRPRQNVIEHLKGAGLGLSDKGSAASSSASSQPAVEAPGFKLFWALGLCIGVLLVGVYLARRYVPGVAVTHTRRLRVVDRLALSSKTSLVMVDVEGQKLLLTVGADRVTHVDHAQIVPSDENYDQGLGLVCAEEMKLSA